MVAYGALLVIVHLLAKKCVSPVAIEVHRHGKKKKMCSTIISNVSLIYSGDGFCIVGA